MRTLIKFLTLVSAMLTTGAPLLITSAFASARVAAEVTTAAAARNSPDAANGLNVTAYCSALGSFDDSCFRNALAALEPGKTSLFQVPSGTFRISSLNVATPNVTFKCLSGATLQPTQSSKGILISANNIVFDGCALDARNVQSAPGIIVTKVSGFTFRNGSIINIGNQPGLQLNQTSNDTIDHNKFITQGTANSVLAYGPTRNIRITNNTGIASFAVISGTYARGNTTGVFFTGNVLQPTANMTILTTGDFSNGLGPASPITNIVVTGNTCNIVAPSPSAAPFACYSLVGSYDLTFSNNIMNATGQYVGNSLLELGASRSTVSNNVFNEGNDPGSQGYHGIIVYYGSVALSQNVFHGSSAYGDSIRLYPQSNADNISISGGSIDAGNSFGAQIISQTPGRGYTGNGSCSVDGGVFTAQARCTATVTQAGGVVFAITYAGRYTVAPIAITTSLSTRGTPATVHVGRAHNQAITIACNQSRIPIRVTGIAGSGPRGPVTSVAVYQYPGANAEVGSGFTTASGTAVTGGSGSGLHLDILAVDRLGGIASVGVTRGDAGSGYKVGDTVFYPVTGSQVAARANGIVIGGGLTISGAVYHALDLLGLPGGKCPVSASIGNVTISGPNDTTSIVTGVYRNNATANLSGPHFAHVASKTDESH